MITPEVSKEVRLLIRTILFVLAMILRFVIGYYAVYQLRSNAIYIYNLIDMLAIIAIAYIVIKKNNPYSMKWIIIIFLLPVFGLLLYLFFERLDRAGGRNKMLRSSISRGIAHLDKDPKVYAELGALHPHRKRMAGFLGRKGFPLYNNTLSEYYPQGELYFDAMLKDMEKAEQFIFLEYFILNTGKLWDRMRDILIAKAKQGVEIRIMIDDIGSIMTFPSKLLDELREHNIQIVRFNDVHGVFSSYYFNYRNHKKITVIDGNIGYTGGSNIADEYINAFPKHGHWKDTGIRLMGEAVWSLTVAFLKLWDGETKTDTNYELYRPTVSVTGQGYYQPFIDGPADGGDNVAKDTYKSIIYNARDYVYITTPYLVIDATMVDALCLAAHGGTDVRIIVPKKWDKRFVHFVSESNYRELLAAGVRIFEYTPGFIHAKTILSDDDHGVIGTINMDYRSFYLHYENGVWICGSPVIQEIKKDFMSTFDICEEIRLEDWIKRPLHLKFMQNTLRLFAVLF
jgi:cardiolipin synthase